MLVSLLDESNWLLPSDDELELLDLFFFNELSIGFKTGDDFFDDYKRGTN